MFNQPKKIVDPLLDWYRKNKRDLPWRHNPTPYRVWISEIMLQQTRVEPVIPYYNRFMESAPSVETLADMPEDQLMKLWEGLGYYSRARNLHKAAKIIAERGAFPATFKEWLSLPGIGEYTAGAICSIALGLPTPAVDGNVLRVISRVAGSFDDIADIETKKRFTAVLRDIYPHDATSDFTQALMELGAMICIPNGKPLCSSCPLADLCAAYREGLIDQIPVKAKKKERKIEVRTVLILRHSNMIALQKRPSSGLLAGLWEFPNFKDLSIDELLHSRFRGIDFDSVTALGKSNHIFTHIEWHMEGYELLIPQKIDGYEWFSIDNILFDKAVPSAFRHYINYLKNLRYEV